MLDRNISRRRLITACATAVVLLATSARAQTIGDIVAERVQEIEREMNRRRMAGSPLPSEWFAERLAPGLDARQRRIAAFHLLQRIPYKLTAWNNDPDSLFSLGRGDCRHKSAAIRRLMRLLGYRAELVQLPFDWADLPIPRDVLSPLTETRGIHDAVEVVIDGERRLVDPTWDPPLGTVGFPVLEVWDGVSSTPFITPRATTIVRAGDIPEGRSIYDQFKIAWPKREKTLAYNRAFNDWSDQVRARAVAIAESR